MKISEIYKYFDEIGCLTFSTVDKNGQPQTRIAHLRGFDDDGIYFMTMDTKSFYEELKLNKKVAICGLNAKPFVNHNDEGFPIFDDGYFIRLTGKVEEIPIQKIIKKNNPIFDLCVNDKKAYPSMVVFCITSGYGEIFDYDFEKIKKDHKLDRIYFSFNGASIVKKGFKINKHKCIKCGSCVKVCSFDAIKKDENGYYVDDARCDECGNCLHACKFDAISSMK